MIDCKDCEYWEEGKAGKGCMADPFENVPESECLQKWTIMRLNLLNLTMAKLVEYYAFMARERAKASDTLTELQNKLLDAIKREEDDWGDGESWKKGFDDGD